MSNNTKERWWNSKLNEFWSEHDGTHFYKDEFRELIASIEDETIKRAKAEISSDLEKLIRDSECHPYIGMSDIMNYAQTLKIKSYEDTDYHS